LALLLTLRGVSQLPLEVERRFSGLIR